MTLLAACFLLLGCRAWACALLTRGVAWRVTLIPTPSAFAPRLTAHPHGAIGETEVRTDIQQAMDNLAKADTAMSDLLVKTKNDATDAAEAEVAPDIAQLNTAISAFLTKYAPLPPLKATALRADLEAGSLLRTLADFPA